MKHYLLIKRDGVSKDGRYLSAREAALALLQVGIWPLWKHTRNRLAIQGGDVVAIYLAGDGGNSVIATAHVDSAAPWTCADAKSYPLVADGEPLSTLHLSNVVLFPEPKHVRPRLEALSFYTGTPKWGAAFMGGTRALSADDFRVLTQ